MLIRKYSMTSWNRKCAKNKLNSFLAQWTSSFSHFEQCVWSTLPQWETFQGPKRIELFKLIYNRQSLVDTILTQFEIVSLRENFHKGFYLISIIFCKDEMASLRLPLWHKLELYTIYRILYITIKTSF